MNSQNALTFKFFFVTPSFLIGWAATVTYNAKAKAEFDRFRQRDDTLSLGVCNGCQLLALLGWVGEGEDDEAGMRKRDRMLPKIVMIGKTTLYL